MPNNTIARRDDAEPRFDPPTDGNRVVRTDQRR
jgi:hypothetical protein